MKILLVRTSALGDIIHCLPFLAALRRAKPDAEIGWVIEKVWAPLLADHPDIDHLFTVRTKDWRKMSPFATVGDVTRTVRTLRTFRADVAVDLMGNHKGALLAKLSGARRVVGARKEDRRERESALWIGEPYETPGPHAVDRALALLDAFGADSEPLDLGGAKLLVEPPETPEVTDLLAELDASEKPLVLIQAGAGWANKTWPAAWWGELARALDAEAGADVRVLLAPGEEHLAEAVVEAGRGSVRIVDAKDFRVLAAVVRRSTLVLGGDTGPVHLAHALGAKVLCLIGPTDPRRNGPYGAPDRVLFRELPCSYCYKRFDEPKTCLLQLTPKLVTQRTLEMLGRG